MTEQSGSNGGGGDEPPISGTSISTMLEEALERDAQLCAAFLRTLQRRVKSSPCIQDTLKICNEAEFAKKKLGAASVPKKMYRINRPPSVRNAVLGEGNLIRNLSKEHFVATVATLHKYDNNQNKNKR